MPSCFSRLRSGAAALVAAGLGVPACAFSVWSTEQQCESDGDCARRGGVFANTTCASGVCVASASTGNAGAGGGAVDPAWACLQDSEVGGSSGAGGGATVRVTFRGVRLDEAEPLVGASVRPCRKSDLECTLLGVAAQLTDASGKTTFELPSGFDGYFEGTRDDIYSILLFPGALTRDIELPSVGGVTPGEAELLASFVRGPEGGPKGAVILSAHDCLGAPAAGVTFGVETQPAPTPFFLIDGTPNTTARATDGGGRGGFLGLPEPAFLHFRAARAATGEVVAEESVFTRVGAVTYVLLSPAP